LGFIPPGNNGIQEIASVIRWLKNDSK